MATHRHSLNPEESFFIRLFESSRMAEVKKPKVSGQDKLVNILPILSFVVIALAGAAIVLF